MLGAKNILKEAGRKGLDQIMKVAMAEREHPMAIANMWTTRHDYEIQTVGKVLSGNAYRALRPRLLENRFFVIPVFREQGLFNVMINNQSEMTLVAPLGEFQKKGDQCATHMTIQFFTELLASKDMVLMRSELKDNVMDKRDATHVTNTFLRYYTLPDCYQFVEQFNKQAHSFDFNRYLKKLQDDAKTWSSIKALHHIDIQEGKGFTWNEVSTLKSDEWGRTVIKPSDLMR
eukprot:TRINITY_DN69534_c0_g1_i1.p1 TRINITY_DN69534_c0_g1~~TRINITY_DN69534_c0_g1_i1.p1  ORF type:complete len:242 (-),score=15.19 TRINITY_DN69534_c0_g1_i1:192-884(-)